VVDALLVHVQAAACCSLVVDTAVSVEALRCAVRDALAEAGCGPPDQPAAHVRASLPPHRLRLCQRVACARTGAVMRDGRAAADYIFGAAADQSLAVQLLAAEERLEGGTLLLGYLLLDAAGCATPAAALHVQAPRWWTHRWADTQIGATSLSLSRSLAPYAQTRTHTHAQTRVHTSHLYHLTCPGVVVV
jgi:hypothetical protein